MRCVDRLNLASGLILQAIFDLAPVKCHQIPSFLRCRENLQNGDGAQYIERRQVFVLSGGVGCFRDHHNLCQSALRLWQICAI